MSARDLNHDLARRIEATNASIIKGDELTISNTADSLACALMYGTRMAELIRAAKTVGAEEAGRLFMAALDDTIIADAEASKRIAAHVSRMGTSGPNNHKPTRGQAARLAHITARDYNFERSPAAVGKAGQDWQPD